MRRVLIIAAVLLTTACSPKGQRYYEVPVKQTVHHAPTTLQPRPLSIPVYTHQSRSSYGIDALAAASRHAQRADFCVDGTGKRSTTFRIDNTLRNGIVLTGGQTSTSGAC